MLVTEVTEVRQLDADQPEGTHTSLRDILSDLQGTLVSQGMCFLLKLWQQKGTQKRKGRCCGKDRAVLFSLDKHRRVIKWA